MSTLRERMIQDMQLRGFSPRSQEYYARAVRKLAEHYHKSPDLITDEELRQYFLHRTNVSCWSRVACTIALCGIKFFCEHTLKRDWATVGLIKPKKCHLLAIVKEQLHPGDPLTVEPSREPSSPHYIPASPTPALCPKCACQMMHIAEIPRKRGPP